MTAARATADAAHSHPWVVSDASQRDAPAEAHAGGSDLDSLVLHEGAAATRPPGPVVAGAAGPDQGQPDVDVDSIAAAEQRHILHLIQLRERHRAGDAGSKGAGGRATAKRGTKGASQPAKKQRSISTLFGA